MFKFIFRAPKHTGDILQASGLLCALYGILTIPTFAARCLSASYTKQELQTVKGETICGRETRRMILPRDADFHEHSRVLLHAVNLLYGTDGFTSPPKEGVLRTFSPLKIWRLRPGLNSRTWVPKASTVPLDHRSHSIPSITFNMQRFIPTVHLMVNLNSKTVRISL
jgi:hypothetical protein